MKYTTPTIVPVESAFEAIRGAKGEPFSGDPHQQVEEH